MVTNDTREAVVVTEAGGICLYCSTVFTETYGYDRVALAAAGGLSALLVDEADRVHLAEVLEQGGTFDRAVAVRHRNGEALMAQLQTEAARDEEGRAVGATGTFTAVADGKEPEAPLTHRLRMEEALLQATHLLVAHGKPDLEEVLGRIGTAIGAECVYLLTLPSEDELLRVYADQDVRAHIEHHLAYAAQGARQVFVWHRHGPDGRAGWLQRFEAAGDDRFSEAEAPERTPVLAVPVLSSRDKLYGYLGFEYGAEDGQDGALMEEDFRVVSVLADVLSAYFERSIAEQALRESEERWRLLVDSHPDPILITVGEDIIYINQSGAKLLGSGEPAEILGRSPFDFMSAEHHALLKEDLEAAGEGRCVVPQERDVIRLDGEERIVEWFSVPIVYKGRHAVQSVLRDVTQRKLAERALQRSEERYRTFVETISEAIWRIELEKPVPLEGTPAAQVQQVYRQGILAECNQSMARLLGEESEEAFLGRRVGVVLPRLGRRLVEEFVQSGYRLHNWEQSIQRKGGQDVHLVINAVGTIEAGRLVRIWGSCVDVTERVELERQMVADLEWQQQQIGRDLHDGVGQFLTGVRMLSSNLAERFFTEGDEGFTLASKVVRFAEGASQRVREIYCGLAPVQLYEDGLAAALEELAGNLDALPDIRCVYRFDGTSDVVEQQASLHLYRIAQEATNNALKHARSKEIQILLGRRDGCIVLEVRDDGVSFDVSQPKAKSLGLRSMYYRARAIGAHFAIDSQPGVGTTIRCELPVEKAAPYLDHAILSGPADPYR